MPLGVLDDDAAFSAEECNELLARSCLGHLAVGASKDVERRQRQRRGEERGEWRRRWSVPGAENSEAEVAEVGGGERGDGGALGEAQDTVDGRVCAQRLGDHGA